ncbi:hypothetical protein NUW58_g7426 [Xylaria curta]|uniref:Uncharacterized protein n=1 Tax=Xylaria curta TaxID=42375 RepID=A0ACC1NHC9_9PEZI|nr:hypothetical protein NUW58_g7426 [Xylaria curta]
MATSPAIPQTTSSSSLVSTQPRIVIRTRQRPRGPIPLVATNSNHTLPAHLIREQEQIHSPRHLDQHSPNTARMDAKSPSRQSTLPAQVEEDIRAAVLASMPPMDHPRHARRRKNVGYRKTMRWLSISLSLVLVIGVVASTLILSYGIEIDAIFSFIWGPLLAIWNGWRLFRLRQQFDQEVISGWHIGLDAAFLSTIVALTAALISWDVNHFKQHFYEYDFRYNVFWRAVAATIVFFLWFILHTVLLIITMVEKWTKPTQAHWDAPPQPPAVVVQYMPTYTACYSHEPQPGEDKNISLAEIGDSQPQGIAPAYSIRTNETPRTEEIP